MVLKQAFLMLILAGIAFGLQISMANYTAVESGKTASVNISIYNDEDIDGFIVLSTVRSTLENMPVFDDQVFLISPFETIKTKFIINASNIEPGKYSLTISAKFSGETHKSMTVDVYSPVRIESVYSTIGTQQGAFERLKFVVENQGGAKRNFVFDPTSLPEEFQAAYPYPFDLESNESAEAEIYVTVPYSLIGQKEYEVRINSGEFSDSAKVKFSIAKGEAKPRFQILNYSLEAYGKRGYSLTLILSSQEDIRNLKVAGLPLSWSVLENNFSIKAGETKSINVTIIPETFEEQIYEVIVVDGTRPIAGTLVTFSGSRVGITGYMLLSGSFTLGLLFAVIIVLALFVVRQRNMFTDLLEESKTFEYFEKLVQKAKNELGFEAAPEKKKDIKEIAWEKTEKIDEKGEREELTREEKMINEILNEEDKAPRLIEEKKVAVKKSEAPGEKLVERAIGEETAIFSEKAVKLDDLLKKPKKKGKRKE